MQAGLARPRVDVRKTRGNYRRGDSEAWTAGAVQKDCRLRYNSQRPKDDSPFGLRKGLSEAGFVFGLQNFKLRTLFVYVAAELPDGYAFTFQRQQKRCSASRSLWIWSGNAVNS
jgi:hypothetical protein